MLNDVILIDTNEIKKDNKVYYVVYVYIASVKAFNTIFVNKDIYEHIQKLPYYENISDMCNFVFDRKTNNFKLVINKI